MCELEVWLKRDKGSDIAKSVLRTTDGKPKEVSEDMGELRWYNEEEAVIQLKSTGSTAL
ncbi:hypothetical protein Slin14017_G063060 [Septoria linicola]|nr:hypothetical protein Slin14017_G063060 [Septoria linicola]